MGIRLVRLFQHLGKLTGRHIHRTHPHDSHPHDSHPLDSQSLDSQSLDSQSLDSQSLDSQSLDSQPHDSQSHDSQPHDSQPAPASPSLTGEKTAPRAWAGCLEFMENGLTVHYYIRDGVSLVGRSRCMDCCLGSPYVSRRHAIIRFQDGRFFVRDTDSKCGTFLNGSRIPLQHGREYEIHPMDVICFADVEATLLPLRRGGGRTGQQK